MDNSNILHKENIQTIKTDEVEELQKDIKKVTNQQISIKKIRELLTSSSLERLQYHLANWHIHKTHQKSEGAGWFITVVENDIAPEKKKTSRTGKKWKKKSPNETILSNENTAVNISKVFM